MIRPSASTMAGVMSPCLWTSPGSTSGMSRAMPAKRLKKPSSCPKTTEGRRITAPGKAATTTASPAALVRA